MESEEKYLVYKERVVFAKQARPWFKRVQKEYAEDEACFIFLNKGAVTVRSQVEEMELNDQSNPPDWNRRLTLELLRKEAESLLK